METWIVIALLVVGFCIGVLWSAYDDRVERWLNKP